jgi:cell division protein FtsZ
MATLNNNKFGNIIKVLGVGGGGSNAVNHMYKQGIIGVDFAICNTDAQAMDSSPVPIKIQLGPNLTEGRGAGSHPNIGKMACEESIDEIRKFLSNQCKMVFITAGMGGGTGTGAAPIVAKTAREMGILTVAIVTLPFIFEGKKRTSQGYDGLKALKDEVDTLIVISNDKLKEIHGNLSISAAFAEADNVLSTAAKGIAEIITVAGYVNVDFEDVNTVMRGGGVAIMGTAAVEGDHRARRAVDLALHSPLLEESDIRGAQHILLNISSGKKEVTMEEIFEITEFIQEEAGHATNLIWGNCYEESLGDKLSVTIIATGFDKDEKIRTSHIEVQKPEKIVVPLEDDEDKEREGRELKNVGFDPKIEGESAFTIEFDDLRSKISSANSDTDAIHDGGQMNKSFSAQAREDALKRIQQVKLSNPKTVIELENEPAYLRRGIKMEDVPDSQKSTFSQYMLSDEHEPSIRKGNSFLHDNVD